jgi:hypothetical protein
MSVAVSVVVMLSVPIHALEYGFSNDPVGTHGSRTIMLAELRLLLAACPACASVQRYRSAIVDDNVLLKETAATRRESFRRLRCGAASTRPFWNSGRPADSLLRT